MKTLAILTLSIIGMAACQKDQPLTARSSIAGTYEVTRLAQYKDGKKTFDGYLPYLTDDSTTLTHRLGISLGNASTNGSDAYIIRSLVRSKGNYKRSIDANIGGFNIKIEDTSSPVVFNFYRNRRTKMGQYEGGVLSFDLVEKDTLNQEVRYVFQAKKVSDIPNQL